MAANVKTEEVPVVDEEFEKRYNIVASVGEECITESELRNLLLKKPNVNFYDGFEPSGRMHIAQGLFKAANVNKCTTDGKGTFIFWVADWFALMNDKMGGDLERIKIVGEYFTEVWKAAGMNMDHVNFFWASDEITQNANRYWSQCLDVARSFNLTRVQKCCQIMGRKEGTLTAAQILYPLMQSTDIFFLKADVCQLGVDQRKVNMLAREYCDAAKIKLKPVILSHHMLFGLKKGQAKMSKSDPDSAIFMEDSAEDVVRKMNNAYCPREPEATEKNEEESLQIEKDELMNPCLDYIRYILFSQPNPTFEVVSEGAKKTYIDFSNIKDDFIAGKIEESDLKESLANAVNRLLEPVRDHFKTDARAGNLLEMVKEFQRQKNSGEKMEPTKEVGHTRRLKLNNSSNPVCVIFSPLAHPNLSFASVLSVINMIKKAPKDHDIMLVLPDWSSFASNCFLGDKKAISAFNTVLIESIKALQPSLLDNVKVVVESEAILSDSNEYWISAINVGRNTSLQTIMEIYGENDAMCAGKVIASLMYVANVLATGASVIICDSPTNEKLAKFTTDYYEEQGIKDLPQPKVVVESFADLTLKDEKNINIGDLDHELFILDSSADVSRKIKRSFCEPGNIDFCPIITLAEHVIIPLNNKVVVSRKPDNGGDLDYGDAARIREDFKSEKLHPGDFKPSVSKSVDSLLDPVRTAMKSAAGKKASGDYKNGMKKLLKSKK